MIRHLTLLPLAAIIGVGIWLLFFAKPLVIHNLEFDHREYSHGEEFTTASRSAKAWWAARFCEATKSTTYLQDSVQQIARFGGPVNFNDGSIKRVVEKGRIPQKFEPGPVRLWKRVTYLCLRLITITITSERSGDARAVVRQ